MKIEDLQLLPEDRLALERIVTILRENMDENCVQLYDLLRQKSTDGCVLMRRGDGARHLVIPEATSQEEKLRYGVIAYIHVFERLREGWKVVEATGKEVDVSKFYSVL